MDAKQIIFWVVGVALCAAVVFMVGLQAGARMEEGSAAPVEALMEQALPGGAGLQAAGAARFSFFDELRTPAAVSKIRKLDSPEGNANNTPELAKKAEKRRAAEARREAWKARSGERGDVAAARPAQHGATERAGQAEEGAQAQDAQPARRTLERPRQAEGSAPTEGGLSLREGVVPSRL